MNAQTPMDFRYDAERSVMVPARPKLADKSYTDGETYKLAPVEERSPNSHNHFFAMLSEAWANLPDDLAERFPTADHLRKFALIKCGFADERSIVCASKAEARRVAAFVEPMDTYALVAVTEAVVRVYTAKSQSMRAMGKAEFYDSKQKVLEMVAAMIQVSSDQLARNAGGAA